MLSTEVSLRAPGPHNTATRTSRNTMIALGPRNTGARWLVRVNPQTLRASHSRRHTATKALMGNPLEAVANNFEDPVLRTAIKEPVAFWGGVFAGLLKLDVNEEPLRSWIDKTASQAGAMPSKAGQSGGSSSSGSGTSSGSSSNGTGRS